MDSYSIISQELLANLISTIITQLQQEPGAVDRNLFSKCFSTLFRAFDSVHNSYTWMIATIPSFLHGLFTIMSLLQTRGSELVDENYLKVIDMSLSLIVTELLSNSLEHLFTVTPEVLQVIRDGCINDPSWKRRLFFACLLTILQINGTDIGISPAFIATLLKEENILVIKASIRLLYLNSSHLRTALQSLSQDHLHQFLVRLINGGNITANDLKTKTQNSYSTDVMTMLSGHIGKISADLLVDCPSVTQHSVNNSGRYMISILRVSTGVRLIKKES